MNDNQDKDRMTHASLFSGIGGAEIAATWMGWTNLFHCEINPFGRKVLEYWYPNSTSYEDITKTDFSEWRGRVDVLTAGFPCQPFSVAGQRKGADDDRYLWPQVIRAVREIRPAWVVGENVAGILTMVQPGEEVEVGSGFALFDENHLYRTEQQYVIETVCQDLEREGYSVHPFVIPACAVGAPHRRDRVWIVARRITSDLADTGTENQRGRQDGAHAVISTPDTQCSGRREIHDEIQPQQPDGQRAYGNGYEQHATDPHSKLSQCGDYSEQEGRDIKRKRVEPPHSPTGWADFPTQSPVCGRDDGISLGLAGISFPKWRAEAIKALGNAWVPQVAYEIFKTIEQCQRNPQPPPVTPPSPSAAMNANTHPSSLGLHPSAATARL